MMIVVSSSENIAVSVGTCPSRLRGDALVLLVLTVVVPSYFRGEACKANLLANL